jgi:hypothetical protein
MIDEFEQVALTTELPEHSLKVGDVGTIVDVTPNAQQYMLEFTDFYGDTIAVIAVRPDQVRRIKSGEIANARTIETQP